MSESEIDDPMRERLKEVSTENLQEAIGKAISDLLGKEYRCHIESIRYGGNILSDSASFKLNIGEHSERPDWLSFKK